MQGTVLVFGGNGYVGQIVATGLERSDIPVLRASRTCSDDAAHVHADITDADSVARAYAYATKGGKVVQALIHASSPRIERVQKAEASPVSRDAHMNVAVAGTEILLSLAHAYRIPHVILLTSEATSLAQSEHQLGAYPEAKYAQEKLATEAARAHTDMCIHTIAPGFLDGGLNDDLPRAFREHIITQSGNTPEDVAKVVCDILTHNSQYTKSGRINPHTGVLTPF
jgi:nucleoside-diphosphate-sugar epimerase